MRPSVSFALSLWIFAAGARAEMPPARILERYRQMLAANPSEGTALDRLWKAYSESGQTAELIESYSNGSSFGEKMILGLLLKRAGRNDDAVRAFQEATAVDATSPLPHLALGGLQVESGSHAHAGDSYEKALQLLPTGDPKISQTLEALGRARMAAGQPEQAAAAWEKNVQLDPQNMELRRRLAELYRENRLPERAIAELQYVALNAPVSERAAANQELSRLFQTLRRPDEAIAALEKAVGLTSPASWLWSELVGQLVRLHQRFDRVGELESRWKKQAGDSPRDAGSHLQLVELYQRVGDQEQQRVWLARLVALTPKNTSLRLRLARLLDEMDRRPESAVMYDALLTEQPGNADAVFERARLDIQGGSPDQAHARIAALVQRKSAEASVAARALEFYQQNRMWTQVEEQLRAEASGNAEDAIVALARFEFSQHRDTEGEATLRRLVDATTPPKERVATLNHIGQLLRSQNLLAAAERTLAESLALATANRKLARQTALLLGEVQGSLGDQKGARLTYLHAIGTSDNPAERDEAEERLFDVLRQMPEEGGRATASGSPETTASPSPNAGAIIANSWLGEYIGGLTREAEATSTEENWLRLARWHSRCRDFAAANADLNRAMALNPQSVAVEEAAVQLGISSGAPILARGHLERLIEIDPAKAAAYRRRLAAIDLQLGMIPDAIRGLAKLIEAAPGDPELLSDLALAQQRAGRTEDALRTWKTVYATASGARKHDAIAPLRRLYESLQRPKDAAELLLAECDARSEPAELLEAFKELLDFCQRNSLVPWLHEQWQARRTRKLEDYATELAWSQLLKAEGDAAGAFAVLSDTLFTAPNPADALPELVRQAEELRRLDAAIAFQSRLVHLEPQARPDALMKLAALQEMNFEIGTAEQSWKALLVRFPREPAVLTEASEFFKRSGESRQSAELLRRLRELEPGNAVALFSLANVDLRDGNLGEAEACLEEILRVAPASRGAEVLHFPALKQEESSRLQSLYLKSVRQRRGVPTAETMRALRGFWADSSEIKHTDDDLRLSAIRALAGLIRTKEDPRSVGAWIGRWQQAAAGTPGEAIWALFYAGANEAAMHVVEQLLNGDPANVQYQQGYIWMALQTRQFPRLAAWLYDGKRTTAERDFARVALTQFLQTTPGKMDPELLAALTPPTGKARMWEMAQLCATSGCFAEAIQLGRRAYDGETVHRPMRGWELAQWELARGEPDSARQMLAEVARLPAESLNSPIYDALCVAYRLLSEADRSAFVDAMQHEAETRSPALPALLKRIVLRGLRGEEGEARDDIRQLLEMRPLAALSEMEIDDPANRTSASERAWAYLRDAGLRLEGWHMEALAQQLWEEALANPALLSLQGKGARAVARDVQTNLLALRVAQAAPDDWAELIEREERGSMGLDAPADIGEALVELGAFTRAVQVNERRWLHDPSDAQTLRNLLNTCRSADDLETAEKALQIPVTQRLFALNDNVRRDFAEQLADLLEHRDAPEEARRMLGQALEGAPFDLRLMHRLATLSVLTGHEEEAAALWRRLLESDERNAEARRGLSQYYERKGKLTEALSVLRGGGPASGLDARLSLVLYAAGQVDEAISTVERLGGSERATASLELAKAMLAKDDRATARSLLQASVARGADPAAAMQMQSALVESFKPATDAILLRRGLLKLRALAGDDPILLGSYFSFLQAHAAALDVVDQSRRELASAWAEGAGLLQAGIVLMGEELGRAPAEGERIFSQILARSDAGEPSLQALLPLLETARRADLAAQVQERLLRLSPSDFDRVATYVRSLEAAGQHSAAVAAMKKWGARAALDPALGPSAAKAWLEIGETDEAAAILKQIAGPKSILRGHEPFLQHAGICLARGEWGRAKALLRRGYESAGARNYLPLVQWLQATGKLDHWAEELSEFRFSPIRMRAIGQSVFAIHEAAGDAAKALALLGSHPELIDGPRLKSLRALAGRAGMYEQAAELMQSVTAQQKDPVTTGEYAALLAEWADAEFAAGRASVAIQRLESAQRVRPDLFAIAQRLHALDRHEGRNEEAKAALTRYLDAAHKEDPDREKAAKLLR